MPVDTTTRGCEIGLRRATGGVVMRRGRRMCRWGLILGLSALPWLATPHARAATGVQLVAANLNFPSMFTVAPDGRFFYAELFTGRIGVFNATTGTDTTYFQVTELCTVGDQGLYGLALHPDFPGNPSLYAYATRRSADGSCHN